MGTCTDEPSRVPLPFLMKCFKVSLGEGMRLESLSMLLFNLVHMLQFFHLEGDEDAMSFAMRMSSVASIMWPGLMSFKTFEDSTSCALIGEVFGSALGHCNDVGTLEELVQTETLQLLHADSHCLTHKMNYMKSKISTRCLLINSGSVEEGPARTKTPSLKNVCSNFQAQEPPNSRFQRCSRCMIAVHCSTECQRGHCKQHNPRCKTYQESKSRQCVVRSALAET